jgi:Holliday junction resolvase RusA-like endonuclease
LQDLYNARNVHLPMKSMEMTPIRFYIDMPPSQIRGNNRSHHIAYNSYFQRYLNTAIGLIIEAKSKQNFKLPFSKSIVSYTFMNNRSIDLDNFIYGMKAVQDALVHADIIADDDALTINPIAKFQKCAIKERKVVVEVYDTSKYDKVAIWGDSELLLVL